MKSTGLSAGDFIEVHFEEDTTHYQFEMPEEFQEVLRTDRTAKKIFDSLRPGNQRSILHLLAKIKSPQKRVDKALVFAERLKMGITNTGTNGMKQICGI